MSDISSTAPAFVPFQVSDIGHSYLPWEIHMKWCEALEKEFFKQGSMELQQNRDASPLMDPSKPGVTSPVNSVAFFNVVSLPLIQAWAPVFHNSGHKLLTQAWQNLNGWQESLLAKQTGHGGPDNKPRRKSDKRKSMDFVRNARASLDFSLRPFGEPKNKVVPAWTIPSAQANANEAPAPPQKVMMVPSAEPLHVVDEPTCTRTISEGLPAVSEHCNPQPTKAEAVIQATSFY